MSTSRPSQDGRHLVVLDRLAWWRRGARWAVTLLCAAACGAAGAAPSVALFYGRNAPFDELRAFDIVVVDPDHGADPVVYGAGPSRLFAYVSVGEAHPTRPWFKDLAPGWQLTKNRVWGSSVLDLTQPQWTAFLVERVFAPLWARGYRGFFLDALDSYRLAPQFDEVAQRRGLVDLIEELHCRFPGVRLILNRGFDIVPAVKDKVVMVAGESLFRGWDAAKRRYVEVKATDRDWLLGQLQAVRDRYGIPVLAIDYVDPADRAGAREVADRVRALGIVPWVTDGDIGSLGVGAVEVMPRKILVVYDGKEAPAIGASMVHRYLTMPMNHLGYVPVYADVNDPLPDSILAGRYAGIVTWFSGYIGPGPRLAEWLERQINAGMRVAVFGTFGLALQGARAQAFGLQAAPAPSRGTLRVVQRKAMIGLEIEPRPDRHRLEPLRLAEAGGHSLLQVADDANRLFDAAALTRWGGYVLDPFTIVEVPGTDQVRWVVDPFAFLQEALALPEIPVPDVTTGSGRRLMFAHVDGDGFPSRAELPGAPFAGQVLFDEILTRFRIPTTVSVIEVEMSAGGRYPAESRELEGIARRIFRLPHVEIASHSYSHPFLDLRREILGSVDYIREQLAPPEKPVRVFQWSGDSVPGADALAVVARAGLLNINGGDTIVTRSNPSLGAVAGLGIEKGGVLQVYAPIGSEARYTNLWRGPFDGFRNVIGTLEMTEAPRRLKPIDIYFHVYSATKRTSLASLRDVYRWAMAQATQPIFASEYIRMVQDFYSLTIARSPDGWLVRGHGEVQTLRAPVALGFPDPQSSAGVGGFMRGGEGTYIHLTGAEAQVRFSNVRPSGAYLAEANARLEESTTADGRLVMKLRGHLPLEFSLANAEECAVTRDGRSIHGRRTVGGALQFRLDETAATVQVLCRRH
jgi:hypothetical protein